MHQIPKPKYFSTRLAVVFAQSIEASCLVENKDVVGAAPTGNVPTTSEWSTILLPTKVQLILEVWQYNLFRISMVTLITWYKVILLMTANCDVRRYLYNFLKVTHRSIIISHLLRHTRKLSSYLKYLTVSLRDELTFCVLQADQIMDFFNIVYCFSFVYE